MVSVGGGKSGPLQVLALLPNPDVISARLGEEIVLFHLITDRFYELKTAILDAIEPALGEMALPASRPSVRKSN